MERRVAQGEMMMGGTDETKCNERMGEMIVQVKLPSGWVSLYDECRKVNLYKCKDETLGFPRL